MLPPSGQSGTASTSESYCTPRFYLFLSPTARTRVHTQQLRMDTAEAAQPRELLCGTENVDWQEREREMHGCITHTDSRGLPSQ